MDQAAQHWTWMRKEYLHKSLHFQVSGVSWEEKAFAEDAAGGLGGCVWPPRVYSCSFCRREFRSAQALGGHMNVHRRDRARLKRSLSGQNEEVVLHSVKPFPTEKYCDAISGNISKVSDQSDGRKGDDYDDDCVETSLSVGRSTNRTGLGCGEEAIRFSKRPRTGGLNQLPPPFVPGDATFLGVKAAKDLELDLELRLGDFH